MAFSGLPSKSCANCRQRRIKCNLAEPECAQCRRAGKECPGYRDRLALLFRDENEKVIRKATGRPLRIENQKSKSVKDQLQDIETWGSKLNSSHTTISGSNSISSVLQLRSQASSLSIPASPSASRCTEDPGIIFFFRHYMTPTTPAASRRLDIFSSYIWWGVSRTKHFADAISCVGLAGLANVNNDPEAMAIARLKYGITLQRVAGALKAPEGSDMGYTLKAVTMLTLFELVSCDGSNAGLWGVHLEGIAALSATKEFQQFYFSQGGKAKHQFFFVMLIKIIHTGQKYPTSLVKWTRAWKQSLHNTDPPAASLAEIMLKFVDLNADLRQGISTDTGRVLQEAFDLDYALEEWKITLPPAWKYKSFIGSQTLGAYDRQYHVYSDQWIAQTWDRYRWIRILVHELILSQLSSLSLEIWEQKSKSLGLISQVASEACVSVSSQLYLPNNGTLATSSKSQLNGVFMLMWPLEIAGSAIGVSEATYNWTLDTLEKLGQVMGIHQTKMVIFQSKVRRECWKSTGAYDCGK